MTAYRALCFVTLVPSKVCSRLTFASATESVGALTEVSCNRLDTSEGPEGAHRSCLRCFACAAICSIEHSNPAHAPAPAHCGGRRRQPANVACHARSRELRRIRPDFAPPLLLGGGIGVLCLAGTRFCLCAAGWTHLARGRGESGQRTLWFSGRRHGIDAHTAYCSGNSPAFHLRHKLGPITVLSSASQRARAVLVSAAFAAQEPGRTSPSCRGSRDTRRGSVGYVPRFATASYRAAFHVLAFSEEAVEAGVRSVEIGADYYFDDPLVCSLRKSSSKSRVEIELAKVLVDNSEHASTVRGGCRQVSERA